MPKLTTITSCWGRPEALAVWLEAIKHASSKDVEHLLFFVGEKAPVIHDGPANLRVVEYPQPSAFSIGHAHNMGARLANSEWIMKIDVDTIPHLGFFHELLPVLEEAEPREWFNVGMLYFKKAFNAALLTKSNMPIGVAAHGMFAANPRTYSQMSYFKPAATNFVCRTQDYLDLGGCDDRFNGYGWEDYQQIYMMERWQRGEDPLPGPLHEHNVTQRCRDELSRPKALEMFRRPEMFFLYHRWHAMSPKPPHIIAANRRVLLENILERRG